MWKLKALIRKILGQPVDVQDKLHDMASRLSDIEGTTVSKNTKGEYDQPLAEGQIIHANLIGAGSILNGPHYCVVVSADPKNDQVTVMPMTSKVKHNTTQYNLGPVNGINSPDNVIKHDQLTTISRRSIVVLRKYRGKDVQLDPKQWRMLRDHIRRSVLKEKTLADIVEKDIGWLIPASIPAEVAERWSKSPVVYMHSSDGVTGTLTFMFLEGSSGFQTLPLVSARMKFKERRALISRLSSGHESVRQDAEVLLNAMVLVSSQTNSAVAGGSAV